MAHEIRERGELEAARRAGEARFRALAESSPYGILYADLSGRVTYANRRWTEISGLTLDDTLGAGGARIIHPDDRDRLRSTVRAAVDDNRECTIEYRINRPDGSVRWLRSRTAPVHLHNGDTVGFVGTTVDITDEVAARRNADRLVRMLEATPDYATIVDAEGRTLFMNQAMRELFGLGPDDDVSSFDWPGVSTDLGRDVVRTELREALRDREVWTGDFTFRAADGRSVPVSTVTVAHPDATGKPIWYSSISHDISGLKAIEERLARNEATLRGIIHGSPIAIFAVDDAGRTQLWNPACEELFGWGADEVLGRPLPIGNELSVDERTNLRRRYAAGEVVGATEFTARTKTGTVEVSASSAPIRDEIGRVVSVMGIVTDITERKRAQEAQRRSEERFRTLVQHSSELVLVWNEDRVITYVSPSVERFTEYGVGDVVGTNDPPLVHPDDRAEVERAFTELREPKAASAPFQARFRRRDGEYRWLEIIATNLCDDEHVNGFLVNARDVSERVEAAREMRAVNEALRESEERYRAIVEDQTELICRFEPDGTLTFVNDAYARYFGSTREELVGVNWIDFVPPERQPELRAHLDQLGPDRPVVSHEHTVRTPDGRVRWQHWTDRIVLDEHGAIVEYQAVGRDVTERRQAEELVADHARVLEMVAQGRPLQEILGAVCRVVERHAPRARSCIALVDEENGTLHPEASPSLPTEFVQAVDGTAIGPDMGSCGSAAYLGRPVTVTDIARDPRWSELRSLALEHDMRACWSTPIKASDDGRVLGTIALYYSEPRGPTTEEEHVVDLGVQLATIAIERKAYETRLAHQAHHDPLTGLPNRTLFLEFLVLSLARGRRFRSRAAVLFLDLDRFKLVNDSLGHDAGDELLVALSQRLTSAVRPGDTVARFGGDEFTILCEDLSARDARQQAVDVAERLLGVIREPFLIDGEENFVSASIGIAVSGERDRPEELLRDADAAMYRAKEQGKGRWELFDDAMRAGAAARRDTENALHRAIERREFRMVYQPILRLSDGRCVGAEALLRWAHPERGLLEPEEFVDLAEETGLIVPIGSWAIEDACRQAARWRDARGGDPFRVSVNLSGRQLTHPDTPAVVRAALEKAGLTPGSLCLEITESVLMVDADSTVAAIETLRSLGVRLSIDDFGTGYSSLGYLKRFPVDSVKIDRSFVDGLGADPEDAAIVTAVVGLGHALDLTVVAEGVETDEQLGQLVALGCDHAQGYLLAPPKPAPDLDGVVTAPEAKLLPSPR